MKLALQKKTKIVATISDIRCEVSFLKELYELGMNVVRINTAHQSPETSQVVIENVRKLSTKIPILVDTKGPEVRTTPMVEADAKGFDVKQGQLIKVTGNPALQSSREMLSVTYSHFVRDVSVGSMLLIDDGDITLKIVDKKEDHVVCEVLNEGTLKGRKTANVPNIQLDLPSLSEKDIKFINWAVDNELDFIAHSFVRNKEDVKAVQDILDSRGSKMKIIAKIENQQGVDNIDEILENVYGIMVARGDLGVEIEAEKIPSIQRYLIKKAQSYEKPVIIATQMLHTMIQNPRPTRAEVSDVANAIYQRTDAIMLSGETAYGKYPTEAVRTMSKIAIEVEKNLSHYKPKERQTSKDKVVVTVAKAAVVTSQQLEAKALITDSYHGTYPRYLSAFRSMIPVYVLCYQEHIMRELALSYGVYCYPARLLKNNEEFSRYAIRLLKDANCLNEEDLVIIVAGNYHVQGPSTYMEIAKVEQLTLNVNQEDYYSN